MNSLLIIKLLKILLKRYVNIIECLDNDNIYIIINAKNLYQIITILKKSIFFKIQILTDLTVIDYINNKNYRFHLIYNLCSYFYNIRIFIIIPIYNEKIVNINSLTKFYNSANWLEREIWDLFGIFFNNHPDLRKILSDYGFIGFPLRKEFPLSGFFEIRYDEILKKTVFENIKLTQEYRVYSFINPWL